MQGLREICDKHEILLISDEVMTGFGRTGAWFAVDNWDVTPDIITMAKGLTSGYAPLGAVGMTKAISAHFKEHVFRSGLTYTAHPVSLAAMIANVRVIQEDKLIENAASLGSSLRQMLIELGEGHPSVGEIRSIGLFGVIELVKNRETKEPMAPWDSSSPEMEVFKKFCRRNGLFVSVHWHTVLIIPPLSITKEQLAEGFKVVDEALNITDEGII